MHTFSSNGIEIAYRDGGEGQPVLLIHGFASNVATNWESTGWAAMLERSGYRVVALDNRGHGQSAKPHDAGLYGAPIMAEDARALLDHLGLTDTHVMGYSMGARIAAFLALRHPERVRSLVFGGLGHNMVRGMAGTGPIAHALEAAHIEDVTNPTARTFRAFAEQTKSDLKALAACIRSSRDPIREDDLARITCPVLVAVGSDDVIGGPAEPLARLIPGAIAMTIEGRDHMKAVGDKAFKDAVVTFLAEVDRR
ncbi:MAG: alpha/beta hydrolase [Hyphomicrobiaceae bacterium]|nr:alpha/beta hydrolase [Hyphomicrobiaceae bacterium]